MKDTLTWCCPNFGVKYGRVLATVQLIGPFCLSHYLLLSYYLQQKGCRGPEYLCNSVIYITLKIISRLILILKLSHQAQFITLFFPFQYCEISISWHFCSSVGIFLVLLPKYPNNLINLILLTLSMILQPTIIWHIPDLYVVLLVFHYKIYLLFYHARSVFNICPCSNMFYMLV